MSVLAEYDRRRGQGAIKPDAAQRPVVAKLDALAEYFTQADRPSGVDPVYPRRNAAGEMEWYVLQPEVFDILTGVDNPKVAAGSNQRKSSTAPFGQSTMQWSNLDLASATVFGSQICRDIRLENRSTGELAKSYPPGLDEEELMLGVPSGNSIGGTAS